MHIAVVHDRTCGSDTPDAVDVLHQSDAVEKALKALGHTSIRLSCDLDLADVRHRIEASGGQTVFNLVESIEGKGRLIHLFPYLLDAMGLPYTGAGTEAMLLTSNKLFAKKRMTATGIPTPPWVSIPGGPGVGTPFPSTWIIKSVWEHASIGMDDSSIVKGTNEKELRRILKERSKASFEMVCDRPIEVPGAGAFQLSSLPASQSKIPASGPPSVLSCPWFAEAFVDGREFNLSVLAGENGPEVLPPAEIIFEGYSREMPKIVDYRAKWDETAYGYHHTPRTFDFSPRDRDLLRTLKRLALDCWKCFSLSGYARVDFRVDETGAPWVLEVNTNPCLSPDAGFAAALERAGISMASAVERILEDSKKDRIANIERPMKYKCV